MSAIPKPEQKTTAHQMWCDRINEKLVEILFPKKIQNGKYSFMTHKDHLQRQCESVLSTVTNHENTRLRVTTDEMILLLSETTKALQVAEQSFKGTPRWRWIQRRLNEQDFEKLKEVQKAYQRAVLVLVNTPPPTAAGKEVKMKVNED